MDNKILDIRMLLKIITEKRKEGNTIAATSGCFDILHAGHVTYLAEAKKCADILIVFLNSDESVKGLKGPQRPIVPEKERAIVISSLECVDYVCIFNESTPCDSISIIKPDFFVKGGDYRGIHIPEIDVLNKYGGEIVFVDMVKGCSSTNIIQKIQNREV